MFQVRRKSFKAPKKMMRTSHSKSLLKEKSSLKTFENAPYEKLIKNIVATQILIKWF